MMSALVGITTRHQGVLSVNINGACMSRYYYLSILSTHAVLQVQTNVQRAQRHVRIILSIDSCIVVQEQNCKGLYILTSSTGLSLLTFMAPSVVVGTVDDAVLATRGSPSPFEAARSLSRSECSHITAIE